jgi:hypothetical protein
MKQDDDRYCDGVLPQRPLFCSVRPALRGVENPFFLRPLVHEKIAKCSDWCHKSDLAWFEGIIAT